MAVGLYRWGIPGMAAAATPYIPLAWEEALGRQVVAHLAPEAGQCQDPERLRKLDRIVQVLTAIHPASPYYIRLSVIDAPAINAFAAPGGRVVILRGLLEKTAGPEQLAGVLAHELQHVYQRHTTRAILEQTGTTLLLTAISGDLSGGLAWGLEGARTMGSLHYSRTHEKEADIEGLRMMQAAHLDPAAMIAFYGIMESGTEGRAGPPDFLSTHPDMGERLATLNYLGRAFLGRGAYAPPRRGLERHSHSLPSPTHLALYAGLHSTSHNTPGPPAHRPPHLCYNPPTCDSYACTRHRR